MVLSVGVGTLAALMLRGTSVMMLWHLFGSGQQTRVSSASFLPATFQDSVKLRNTGVKFQDLIKARRLQKKIDERVLNFGWGHIACV
jgi:hypothetical protein